MKLRKEDKVIVITGKDKGKTGVVMAVFPNENTVAVENINMMKRHTKPSKKYPRGGIMEIARPINTSKIMVIDPDSGKPARIGYVIKADGSKERIFKVSRNHTHPVAKPEKAKKDDVKSAKKPAKAESQVKTEAKSKGTKS